MNETESWKPLRKGRRREKGTPFAIYRVRDVPRKVFRNQKSHQGQNAPNRLKAESSCFANFLHGQYGFVEGQVGI